MASGQRHLRRVVRRINGILAIGATVSVAQGCAVTLRGVVEAPEGLPTLRMIDGRALRLVAIGPAAGLGELDGAWVELEGQRALGAVRVGWWTVTEGPHGFPAYVGVLQPLGSQLGIVDRGSGATLLLDRAATDQLWPDRGRLVVLEGYIDGPHQVHVTWSRVVEDGPAEAR